MTVNADLPPLEPERVRQLLSEWFAKRATAEVALIEETDPAPDPYGSYQIAYEAVFEPSSLDKARVEMWVTTDGDVSIGLEQYERIARRLGVRRTKYGCVFAAGYEPVPTSESGLLALLDSIADGRIAITTTTIPLVGLISTKALILEGAWQTLVSEGYSCPVKWLKVLRRTEFPSKRSVLTYRPW